MNLKYILPFVLCFTSLVLSAQNWSDGCDTTTNTAIRIEHNSNPKIEDCCWSYVSGNWAKRLNCDNVKGGACGSSVVLPPQFNMFTTCIEGAPYFIKVYEDFSTDTSAAPTYIEDWCACDIDTDGDGVSDARETVDSTDPLDPCSLVATNRTMCVTYTGTCP